MKRKDLAALLTRAAAVIEDPDSETGAERAQLVEDLVAASAELEGALIRIRCTDQLGNIAYIIKEGGQVSCVLANGIPAALSYGVGHVKDEMSLKFSIADANTPEQALQAVRAAAGSSRKAELI
ncbi:MAG: hypothetical protein M9895_04355 [Aquamicrobium sp.]|uniref:hypothetical protein n=1 Tax=Aquamicrobium sp. TaxID=1872579 RepID=UPI00349E99C3|nr:hypothetical protein [Aquamicrobium sp.]MCO5157943.1 hypothetical protein [Aquamicrobium sp.]